LGFAAATHASSQYRVACLVSADPRFVAAADAWPRARLAIVLAPLNQILIKGFFLVHGFGKVAAPDCQRGKRRMAGGCWFQASPNPSAGTRTSSPHDQAEFHATANPEQMLLT